MKDFEKLTTLLKIQIDELESIDPSDVDSQGHKILEMHKTIELISSIVLGKQIYKMEQDTNMLHQQIKVNI